MPIASRPTLVIFDCDGVLVDSEALASRVMSRTLTELGFPLTAEQCVERYSGISMAATIEKIEAEWGARLPPDFAETVRARDFKAFSAELEPIAGVREVVSTLPISKCVASSGRLVKIRHTLIKTGLLEFFDPFLFSAEMVSRSKPHPDLFLYAANQMAASPADCIVVEDSTAGVLAARAAEMPVIAFTGGGHMTPAHADRLAAAGVNAVISTMSELLGVVGAGYLANCARAVSRPLI